MVDDTPVANFNDHGYFDGRNFIVEARLDFVSEGAHVIWARRRGTIAGWGHRQVFLWRPEDRLKPVPHGAHAHCGTGFSLSHALFIAKNGTPPAIAFHRRHRWPRITWTTMRSTRGMKMVGLANLETLPPGEYVTELRFLGRVVAERRLERLPV